MRYFKKFDSFINEAAFKSDHDFNIVDMLAPLFRGVNGLFNKAKLYSIQNDLDNYLEKKYNEYENKKGDTEKTDNDVKITSNKLSVADELYVNGKTSNDEKESDSTEKQIPQLHTPVPEPKSETEQEPINNINNNEEPITPQNPIVVNKRSQYVTSREMEECEEILKVSYLENDIDGVRKSIRSNTEEMREFENEIRDLSDVMKSLKDARSKALKDLSKHKPNSVDYERIKNTVLDNCNKDIKKTQEKLDKATDGYENSKWWVEQFQNNLVHFENKMKTNESSEIKPANWTEKDISELRKTINPYQIDEFFIRAEIITANSKSDSLKGAWQLMVAKTAKKWYWAYGDIKTLKNPSSNYTKDDKNLSLTSMTIENVYKESKRVIYPFNDLKSYKEDYYILKNINSMTLLKKILGENDTYVFFILGNIIVDKKTNNMVVEYLFDKTKHKEMILNINDTKYKFVNQDEYPILVENNGYITNNTPPILLKNTDIQTLSTNDFKKLLSDSGIMKFDDVKLSKEYIDKIKTTYIDGKK